MGRSSVADTTSLLNIGEEYHTSERMVNVLFVYVLNRHGQPFMPCQPRKARLLLKRGRQKSYEWNLSLFNCSMAAVAINKQFLWGSMLGHSTLGSQRRQKRRSCLRQKCNPALIFRSFWQRVSSFVGQEEAARHNTVLLVSTTERNQRAGWHPLSNTRWMSI